MAATLTLSSGENIDLTARQVELLKEKHPDKKLISELEKDAGRLEQITERFSKIGSGLSSMGQEIWSGFTR